jgi:hypothetical protein
MREAQQAWDERRAAHDAMRAERAKAGHFQVTTRAERIRQFLAACEGVVDALREDVAPELVLRSNLFGFRGRELAEGWPLYETRVEARPAGNSSSIDGLSRHIDSTPYPATPARMSGVILDFGGTPKRFDGEPLKTTRYEMEDGSIQRVVRLGGAVIETLDYDTLVNGGHDTESLLRHLVDLAFAHEIRPSQPGHGPRHAARGA